MVDVRALAPHRWAMALGIACMGALLVGPLPASAWLAAICVSETVIWFACKPFVRDLNAVGAGARRAGIAALLLNHVVWFGFILAFWFDHRPTVRFIALVFWFGSLLYNQSHSFKSPGAVVMYCVLMAALAVLFLATLGPVSWVERAGLTMAFLLAAHNSLNACLLDYRAAEKLAATAEALRAETRAAEAASVAKSAFLAMMSHELRTPMNGVLGLAHALRATPLDPRQAEMVDTQLRSGDALMTILNDILDLSKIEAGRVELAAAPTEPRTLVDDVARLWERMAADKGLTLSAQVDDGVPAAVLADGARVRQILVNLTSNALKFTDRGGVVIRVEAAIVAGAAGLRLSVSDTGAGIPEELRPRLFSPFAQADSSMAKRAGGTGLGLAIARRLAGMMGGTLALADTSAAGSRFVLEIPAPAVARPERVAAPAEAGCPPGLRVLAAEDNAVNRKVLAALLEPLACRLELVEDGRQALEALRLRPFDLVLMDINMPVMDGLEATAAIREGRAGPADVPVVALTAHALTEEREHLLAGGFDAVLAKPIRPAELIAVLSGVSVPQPQLQPLTAAA